MPSQNKPESLGNTSQSIISTGYVSVLRWHLVLTILLPLFSITLSAQHPNITAEAGYGLDPMLYNGKKYSYYLPPSVDGDQYLAGTTFSAGRIVIKGTVFLVDQLNYDLFNQLVLLKYENEAGAKSVIELSKAWMEGFSIGPSNFELISLPGKEQRIYQVLGSNDLRFLIFRWKTLKMDMAYGSGRYVFSPPEKEIFFQFRGQNHPIKNNKAFIKVFDPEIQPEIRKTLKVHHIKIKKADDLALTRLLTSCENPPK